MLKPLNKELDKKKENKSKMRTMTLTAIMILLSFSVSFGNMNYDCPKSKAGSEYGNRGARLWEAGSLDAAEKETRQAIKIDPDCSMWQQNLGVILEGKNKRDEANEAFLKSLKINKNWCTSYKTGSLLKIGRYYYDKRKYKESIAYFTQASDMAAKENANIDTKALTFPRC